MEFNRREVLRALGSGVCFGLEGGLLVGNLINDKSQPAWATDFPTLDKALNGGIHENDLVLVMGSAGAGKTSFIDQLYVKAGGKPWVEDNRGNYDALIFGKMTSVYHRNFDLDNPPNSDVFSTPIDGSIKIIGMPVPRRGAHLEVRRGVAPSLDVQQKRLMLRCQLYQKADIVLSLRTPEDMGKHWSSGPTKIHVLKNKYGQNVDFGIHTSIFGCQEI